LAAARQGAREGTLVDVATDERFIGALLDLMGRAETVTTDALQLEFMPGMNFPPGPIALGGPVRAIATEQSNTTALAGNRFVVKLFRKIEPGINPEVEIGHFLTDVVAFANAPPLLGHAELVDGDKRSALAVVHGFVENQGDAWTVTSAYLDRFVDEQRLLATDDAASDELTAYQRVAALVGRRLAQMQIALANRDDIEAFRPEPIAAADTAAWIRALMKRADRVHEALSTRRDTLPEADRALADGVLARAEGFERRLRQLLPEQVDAVKIRHHGDFHLGQILMAKDDAYIIDFEGEPRRGIGDRRRKAPAARDVAGLVRSIDYSTTAAQQRALQSAPDAHGKIARALDVWRERSAATFVETYRETMRDRALWPADAADADRLLDFFLIEKVYYEIEYELAYRPDWLRVPLAGILRILAREEAA
jgi:maltose alpha-D-glucosyltransferase/alpha-amylase